MTGPSFANDIAPILFPFRGQMAWRFDLADYGDVKANAEVIWKQIRWTPQKPPAPPAPPNMPPPPFSPFPDDFLALFQQWMANPAP